MSKLYAITVNTPPEASKQVRKAMGAAGAGQISGYMFCSFTHTGTGRYLASHEAHPSHGLAGKMNETPEEKIETFCTPDKLTAVIEAIRKVHPYEEPAITYWAVEII